MLYILILYEHVMNLSHNFQHPKVKYTLVGRKEIRLVKILDAWNMQLKDEMARPVNVKWQGRPTEEAT